jgi:hypothetical protein
MDVVGHGDETAPVPTVARRAIEKECNETVKGRFVVQNVGAAIHAYRQEIRNVPVEIRPNAMKATKAAGWWLVRRENGGTV